MNNLKTLVFATAVCLAGASPLSADALTLRQCLDLALSASPEVRAAALSLEATQAKQWEAWGNFLPKLTYQVFGDQAQRDIYPYDSWDSLAQVSTAVGSGLATKDPYGAAALQGLAQGLNSQTSTQMSGYGVGLVLPIDTSGRMLAVTALAGQQKDLADSEYLRTKEQMAFRVRKTFYQLWLAEKALLVAQSSYANLQHHVDTAQGQLDLGKISNFEVLRSRVQRDAIKPQLIAAQNSVALAKLQLATLVRRAGDTLEIVFDDASTVPSDAVPTVDDALAAAYASRPEVHSAALQTQMSDTQTRLAVADLLPNMAFSLQYRGVSPTDFTTSKWFESENQQWVAQLSLSGSIDALSTPSRIVASNANAQAARQKLEAVRDQIRLDVEQALLNRRQSLESVEATKASIELAQTAYDMAESRFAAGLATNLDVLDSRLALDQAQISYYQSVAGAATADAALTLALGKE
jgi:outer membrane protein TolC